MPLSDLSHRVGQRGRTDMGKDKSDSGQGGLRKENTETTDREGRKVPLE